MIAIIAECHIHFDSDCTFSFFNVKSMFSHRPSNLFVSEYILKLYCCIAAAAAALLQIYIMTLLSFYPGKNNNDTSNVQ